MQFWFNAILEVTDDQLSATVKPEPDGACQSKPSTEIIIIKPNVKITCSSNIQPHSLKFSATDEIK